MSKWYEEAVFYHMYPLGMTGAPKQNNGEERTEQTERFDELEQWIPYIKQLGMTAIYIGPLFESSTHGYDTKDYKLVDTRLGTNEDFIRFVSLCHDNQIRVVVDGVFNHTGREFFAFRDIQEKRESSPYRDWYKGVNFGWQSPLGDSFGYEAWQGHYELPCLNHWNPAVREYLFDVIQYWVDTFDIDGIRLDCANVLDFHFMEEMRQKTAHMKEDFWLMGEVIHGEYSRWVNPSMLHSVTNYELHKSLYSGHNDHNYFEIAHNVRRLEKIAPVLYTFLDNHDEDRIASKLICKEHLYPIHICLFTLPGIPSIYYGSEWAIEGRRTRNSDDALRPQVSSKDLPKIHYCLETETKEQNTKEQNTIEHNTKEQNTSEIPSQLTDFIAQLAHIHSAHQAYHAGSYKELLLTNRQYAFAREKDGETMITAVNNDSNDSSICIPLPCPAKKAIDLLSGEELTIENGKLIVTIKKYYGMIIKLMELS